MSTAVDAPMAVVPEMTSGEPGLNACMYSCALRRSSRRVRGALAWRDGPLPDPAAAGMSAEYTSFTVPGTTASTLLIDS